MKCWQGPWWTWSFGSANNNPVMQSINTWYLVVVLSNHCTVENLNCGGDSENSGPDYHVLTITDQGPGNANGRIRASGSGSQ